MVSQLVRFTDAEIETLERYRVEHGLRSRAECIRHLIEKARIGLHLTEIVRLTEEAGGYDKELAHLKEAEGAEKPKGYGALKDDPVTQALREAVENTVHLGPVRKAPGSMLKGGKRK